MLAVRVALATVMLVVVPAASASADARVRFVNAAGGSDAVQLQATVGGKDVAIGGATAFGQATDFTSVPAGDAEFSLTGGGKAPPAKQTLQNGRSYTAVALSKGSNGLSLQVMKNGRGVAGDARIRVLHVAPELGTPDVRIGDRTIAQGVSFRSATDYLTLGPGTYELKITKPNGGDPILTEQVSLAAGTASTVILAGSGGSAAQAIVVQDAAVTPKGAPGTGLGGLAEGDSGAWALVLLAALAAGTLGGAAQIARTRRSRP